MPSECVLWARVGGGEDQRVRVLVVSEDPLARQGLAGALTSEPAIEVIAQASGSDDVVGAAGALAADAVLWDLGMDATTGLGRLRSLQGLEPPLLVLLVDPSHADEVFALGARGLLFRDGDVPRLAASLSAIARGVIVLEDAIALALVRRRSPSYGPSEALTRREVEVLECLALGASNKAIAEELGISEHTVKFHVNAILTKLGAESRTEAVVLAARLGLVAL